MLIRLFSFIIMALITFGCGNDNVLSYERIEEVEVYPDVWVDSFVQPVATEGYDILWVIDRSGSMNSHDANLLLGIETMMNVLPQTQWRLVMINISSMNSANHQDFPLIPGDTLADAQSMYAGLGGSGREEGFKSLQTYIQEAPLLG